MGDGCHVNVVVAEHMIFQAIIFEVWHILNTCILDTLIILQQPILVSDHGSSILYYRQATWISFHLLYQPFLFWLQRLLNSKLILQTRHINPILLPVSYDYHKMLKEPKYEANKS